MARSILEQSRAVDPYASYNSDIVNKLTGIVTRGSDALDYYNSLQVIPDSTSALDHVEVLPGIIYKDDMLIEITSPYRVDFTDPAQYVSASGDPFNTEAGIYYIVLEYTYIKSRPAPQAHIKILLPSQITSFQAGNFPSLFFLKAVDVAVNVGVGSIVELYDYDPNDASTKREYIRNYASSEVGLPTFDAARDQSRIAYNPLEDQFYFGYSDRWDIPGGDTFEVNTLGVSKGDLVFVTASGDMDRARSNLPSTTSDGSAISIDANGRVQTSGKVVDVPIESGIVPAVGNLLYLSGTDPGTITNSKTLPFWQFVGRCLEVIDGTSVSMLYVRGEPNGALDVELGFGSSFIVDDSTGSWTIDGSSYKHDFDVSEFKDGEAIVTIWDATTGFVIQPEKIEYVDPNTISIWMPLPQVLGAILVGAPTISVGSSSLARISEILSAGSWNLSGGRYYQDVDLTSLNLTEEGLAITTWNSSTGEEIVPTDIQFDSTSSVRIWMPDNTVSVRVTAVGISSDVSDIVKFSTVFPAGGAWVLMGGSYYQDLELSDSGITGRVVLGFIDDDTSEKIQVEAVEPGLTPTTLRVWMPDNTHNVKVIVVG